jgi:hypothetical protein
MCGQGVAGNRKSPAMPLRHMAGLFTWRRSGDRRRTALRLHPARLSILSGVASDGAFPYLTLLALLDCLPPKGAIMRIALLLAVLCFTATAYSANHPCSGSKGGVDHCVGEQFLCRDGSISASKRVCSAPDAGASPPTPKSVAPGSNGACSCRSGQYCTGPRGGTFCYSDSGKKSYLRK